MVKKWLDQIFLLLLIITLLYLEFSNKLKLLINPKYFTLIYLALFILILLLLFSIFNLGTKVRINNYITNYILISIIIVLIFSSSYSDFQKNISEIKGIKIGDDIVYDEEIETNNEELPDTANKWGEPPKVYLAEEDFIKIDDTNFYKVLDSLYINPEHYTGKTLNIKGFITKFDGLSENHFVISRLIMMCCAADSSVCGLVCDASIFDYTFEEDGWYEIEGVIETQNITINSRSSDNPVIRIVHYNKIEPLTDPYVYPEFY